MKNFHIFIIIFYRFIDLNDLYKSMETKSLVNIDLGNDSDQNTVEAVKYKELLEKMSKRPRYQVLVAITISAFWIIITFNAMIGSFVFMNPLFKCSGEGRTEKQACQNLNECIIENDFTAAVKNELYCDKLDIRSTVQSIFALGLVIGMIAFPLSGDFFGRRRSIIGVFVVGVIAISTMIIAIIYDIEILVILSSTLTGVFGGGMTIMGFILTCDFFPETMRQKCLLIYCSMWGVGEMCFYLFYFYMNEWDKYLLYAMLIPIGVILIILIYFKLQSPVYAIFIKKDIKKFNQILTSLARYNKISQQQRQQIEQSALEIIEILKLKQQKQRLLLETLKKIIFNRANLRTCVCLMIALISFNFFYYGIQGSMERTGFNFGVSMLLVGANQFLAYLSASYITKFIPRKLGLFVSIVFTSGVGLLFILQAVKDNQAAQTAILILARIGSVYAYCFLLLLQSQLLAVEIRSTAVAILVSIGEMSRIIVPYIINLFNNLGIHIIIATSFFFVIFGVFPIFGLRETYVNKNKAKNDQSQKQNGQFAEVVQERQ